MENQPITSVKGVGEAQGKKFELLGIHTVSDLLEYFPRRYEDYSNVRSLGEVAPGPVTVRATIENARGRHVRRAMHITEATAASDDGKTRVKLIWFNQPYRANGIKPGEQYFISGNYELSHGRFAIMNPSTELISDFPVNTARIIPVYRETKGLTSTQIRRALREVFEAEQLAETLPAWLIKQNKLMSRQDAVHQMHFPQNNELLAMARWRLGFEEVFRLTLASLLNKYELLQDTALTIPFKQELAEAFVKSLPFTLMPAQKKVVWHIYKDLEKTQPMNRLVEGDVGSGKTVVATMGALMPLAEGYQVAFMAPTELLARQHAETIYKLLEPLDMQNTLALLVGGMKTSEKNQVYEHIASGRAKFIIGTHALIQEKVDMQNLGLVIIDEQHRFGVEQRKKMMAKAGHMPHMLSLTATPIPRSLALTLYGELDVSIIDKKPEGRKPVITKITSPNSRPQLYAHIDGQLDAGRQMFVVCPLIAESKGKAKSARSAEEVYADFAAHHFKHRRIGLLHGKMKPAEKNDIMQQFVSHELDILVSTTVIEVGVDVPNASVMLIEGAERCGLAQIHQLRGRVGRGQFGGYCYLMMSDSSAPPKRLEALEQLNDGFKLAELDLELRGPGAIYDTLQHGHGLGLQVAKITDVKLIALARQMAQTFIDMDETLLQYKQLHKSVQALRAVTNLN